MTIADILTLDWTLDIAVCAKIALFAFAHSGALVAILDTGALLSATTNTSQDVRFAFHCTVTPQKSSFTDTFCLLCTIRCTEPIARAHSALSVFCTHHSALFPQEPSLTLAEGDLLLLVVITFAVSAAHAVISRAWAPVLTCVSTPRRQTLAHSLPCRVSFAFAIFATDLLVQAQWALFIALGSHKLRLTPAASFLLLCIEKTRAVTSAALCAIFFGVQDTAAHTWVQSFQLHSGISLVGLALHRDQRTQVPCARMSSLDETSRDWSYRNHRHCYCRRCKV